LQGLIQDKGGEKQIGTATRVLAEVIAADAAWLSAFNRAIDQIMENNQKARQNPKALATLDGYKRGLVNSLTGNLAKFWIRARRPGRDPGRNHRRDAIRKHR
jgi:hypothetical protein